MAKKRFNIVQPSTRAFIKEARKTPIVDYLISCMAMFIHAGHICISASEKENTHFLLSWKSYPASSAAYFYLV